MADSSGRISQIGVAVPITPPKDDLPHKTPAVVSSRTMGNQDSPPPTYPGLLAYDGFQNIELGPMPAAGKPIPSIPQATRGGFDMMYFRPDKGHQRRLYIIGIIFLALILIVVASFFVAKTIDHHQQQQPAPQTLTTSAIPISIQSITQVTTVPTTVLSISTATPTLTTVVATTVTTFSFGITALPPSSTARLHTIPG